MISADVLGDDDVLKWSRKLLGPQAIATTPGEGIDGRWQRMKFQRRL